MEIQNNTLNHAVPDAFALPFPREWLTTEPKRVEDILRGLSVEEQARLVQRLQGKERLELIYLSSKGVELVRALAAEELYYMIKETGEESCIPILAVMSTAQLQYFFDLEWWQGDRFVPERAVHWIDLLDHCEDPQVLNWFVTEDFDQKVMVLQSLIKVVKDDEMTADESGTENMVQFSIDGVYQIFVKIPDTEDVLKKFLKLLRVDYEKIYFAVLEAVIWYPVTATVEQAYKWRQARVVEHGIPEFDEALAVYGQLTPETLQVDVPSPEDFSKGGVYQVAPQYPLACLEGGRFFTQSLALLADFQRQEAIRWELVYLANKVMVADKRDPADMNAQREVMRKVLGYVNIGLELGAKGDPALGQKLLGRTWMQSLFQVGFGRLIQIKWEAERLLRDQGKLVDLLVTDFDRDRLAGLICRFPRLADAVEGEISLAWRDFECMDDISRVERLLGRIHFIVRLCKQCLGLSAARVEEIRAACAHPERREEADHLHMVLTALARFTLFKEVSCEPLPEPAALTFLQMIFLPPLDKTEPRHCKEELLSAFRDRLLQMPMAWTPEDTAHLDRLVVECGSILRGQFGKFDPSRRMDWKFTRGLMIARGLA